MVVDIALMIFMFFLGYFQQKRFEEQQALNRVFLMALQEHRDKISELELVINETRLDMCHYKSLTK